MKACKPKKILGNIHSYETFGAHEGPGIRFVVFFQGCIARCLYCQNPDTWQEGIGKKVEAEEIVRRVERCLPYIKSSGGGITLSGGEPLLQMDFARRLLWLCKKKRIRTAIDTAAFYRPSDKAKLPQLLAVTDLFIVDIKAVEGKLHKKITAQESDGVMQFIAMLEGLKKQYWLRYVLVPGLNDSARQIRKLGQFVRGLKYCSHFEFLPYHTLGKHKWSHLGLVYPLEGIRPATVKDIQKAEQLISFK